MRKRSLIILLCIAMMCTAFLFSCNKNEEGTTDASESDTESTPTEKETEKGTEMDYEGFVITKANKDNLKIICSAEKCSDLSRSQTKAGAEWRSDDTD